MNDEKRESLTGEPDPCPLCGGRLRQIPHGATGLKVFVVLERSGDGSTTVIQLIAMAGGLKEFADGKNILVMRTENGTQTAYTFDYQQLLKRKNLRQNIELKPGDTVIIP